MFRSVATDVMPTDKVVSRRLLNEETVKVDQEVAKALKGKYVTLSSDGWKDGYSVTGVDAFSDGKSYLIDIIHTRGKKKDGESMCQSFCDQIDKTETVVNVLFSYGHGFWDLLGQLILADYFKENGKAAVTTEDASTLIGWVNNHERVRDIFMPSGAETFEANLNC
ncbi:hypothetical protein B0H11DRAFT_2238726 [Mycena galericulata]|nr:hypothetical protein B0H11DRAFT_2238726 [Mycena galericulata]